MDNAVLVPPREIEPVLQNNQLKFGHYIDHPDIFFEMVEMSPMAMILTNPRLPDNPIVFTNRAFCLMTGYPADEIVGRNCRFLQGPATDPVTVTELREGIAAEREVSAKILNYRRDGTPFWNALLISSLYSSTGELAYFVASEISVERWDRILAWDQILDSESPNKALERLVLRSDDMAAEVRSLSSVLSSYRQTSPQSPAPSPRTAEALARTAAAIEHASQRMALLVQQLTQVSEEDD